jgi:hypothetical protein
VGSLLLGAFLRQVMPYDAAANRTSDRMVSSVVARHAADNSSLDAAGGVCRTYC